MDKDKVNRLILLASKYLTEKDLLKASVTLNMIFDEVNKKEDEGYASQKDWQESHDDYFYEQEDYDENKPEEQMAGEEHV